MEPRSWGCWAAEKLHTGYIAGDMRVLLSDTKISTGSVPRSFLHAKGGCYELHSTNSRIAEGKKESQEYVARVIGLTVRQYQRYEAGEQNPNLDNFCALADHFGVSLDYLAGRTEVREIAQEKEKRLL